MYSLINTVFINGCVCHIRLKKDPCFSPNYANDLLSELIPHLSAFNIKYMNQMLSKGTLTL